MSTTPRQLTVTKLERHLDGYWQARVSINGETVPVHRKFGAWYADVPDKPGHLRGVMPWVAVVLAEKVRQIERREREAREARRVAAVASGRVPVTVANPPASPVWTALSALGVRVKVQVRDPLLA